MPGLANPTKPVTEIDSDDIVRGLLREILAEARLMNLQLSLITKLELTTAELEI